MNRQQLEAIAAERWPDIEVAPENRRSYYMSGDDPAVDRRNDEQATIEEFIDLIEAAEQREAAARDARAAELIRDMMGDIRKRLELKSAAEDQIRSLIAASTTGMIAVPVTRLQSWLEALDPTQERETVEGYDAAAAEEARA